MSRLTNAQNLTKVVMIFSVCFLAFTSQAGAIRQNGIIRPNRNSRAERLSHYLILRTQHSVSKRSIPRHQIRPTSLGVRDLPRRTVASDPPVPGHRCSKSARRIQYSTSPHHIVRWADRSAIGQQRVLVPTPTVTHSPRRMESIKSYGDPKKLVAAPEADELLTNTLSSSSLRQRTSRTLPGRKFFPAPISEISWNLERVEHRRLAAGIAAAEQYGIPAGQIVTASIFLQ